MDLIRREDLAIFLLAKIFGYFQVRCYSKYFGNESMHNSHSSCVDIHVALSSSKSPRIERMAPARTKKCLFERQAIVVSNLGYLTQKSHMFPLSEDNASTFHVNLLAQLAAHFFSKT